MGVAEFSTSSKPPVRTSAHSIEDHHRLGQSQRRAAKGRSNVFQQDVITVGKQLANLCHGLGRVRLELAGLGLDAQLQAHAEVLHGVFFGL